MPDNKITVREFEFDLSDICNELKDECSIYVREYSVCESPDAWYSDDGTRSFSRCMEDKVCTFKGGRSKVFSTTATFDDIKTLIIQTLERKKMQYKMKIRDLSRKQDAVNSANIVKIDEG